MLKWLRPGDGPRDQLRGVAWPSGRTLFLVTGQKVDQYQVAPNGSYVVTLCDEVDKGLAVRRYDVPPPKPWPWIVGVPLAAGASLLVLRGLLALWKRRAVARKQDGDAATQPA